MKIYRNERFGEERALYGVDGAELIECSFDGIEDGESALKEGKNIKCNNVFFNLRYPLWHDSTVLIENSEMTELCRAALWYSKDITVVDSKLNGIKALRECKDISIANSTISSAEFGWRCSKIDVRGGSISGEYAFFESKNLNLEGVEFSGKYSFKSLILPGVPITTCGCIFKVLFCFVLSIPPLISLTRHPSSASDKSLALMYNCKANSRVGAVITTCTSFNSGSILSIIGIKKA